MNCSTPGFPVHHQLPELAQTHFIELVMPSNYLILCHLLLLLPSVFPSIRVFSNESVLCISMQRILCQSIGTSVLASVLPMNIQDWFSLGLTDLISLQSKGLSRVFSDTTVQKHQFSLFKRLCAHPNKSVLFGHQSDSCFLYGPTLTSIPDY